MPSKILRDEETGLQYEISEYCLALYANKIPSPPKPEPTLEEKVTSITTAWTPSVEYSQMFTKVAKTIIAEIGRIYNLERKDGK